MAFKSGGLTFVGGIPLLTRTAAWGQERWECSPRTPPSAAFVRWLRSIEDGDGLWYARRTTEGRAGAWDGPAGRLAAFAFVATLLWPAFRALAFEPGEARWPIKTRVSDGADLDHPTPVDLGDVIDAGDAGKLPDAP